MMLSRRFMQGSKHEVHRLMLSRKISGGDPVEHAIQPSPNLSITHSLSAWAYARGTWDRRPVWAGPDLRGNRNDDGEQGDEQRPSRPPVGVPGDCVRLLREDCVACPLSDLGPTSCVCLRSLQRSEVRRDELQSVSPAVRTHFPVLVNLVLPLQVQDFLERFDLFIDRTSAKRAPRKPQPGQAPHTVKLGRQRGEGHRTLRPIPTRLCRPPT